MKITIDNHGGAGAVDYTQSLCGSALKILRSLNQPTQCTFMVDTNASGLSVPVHFARVVISSDSSQILFTGYVSRSPAPVLRGMGVKGNIYVQQVGAVSDELLLNQQSVPATPGSTGIALALAMTSLTQRVDSSRISLATIATTNAVGYFAADAARDWSQNAGLLAAMARTSYRVINGQLTVQQIGTINHVFSEASGTLDVSSLSLAQVKTLANDITVCGETEPQAYVTDVFQGDGTTTTFTLTRKPIRVPSTKASMVNDSFGGPFLNSVLWNVVDPGSRLSLSAAGLAIHGGNGLDGQTTLSAVDNIEMAGALVLIAGGVQASGASDGYIACFYAGSILLPNLFAGFHVKQSAGVSVVTPVINGVETGASSAMVAGHAYSFRLRFYSNEMQRIASTYYVTGTTGQVAFGGGLLATAARVVFELQDTSGGVNQPPIVLYDGSASSAPGTCILAAVNSPAFVGSVQSISLEQTGSAWVTSSVSGAAAFTRRLGLATTGSDCNLTSAGSLTFYPTSVPQAGEIVTAIYRIGGASVARLLNAASITAQNTSTIPGVSRWIGSVTTPAARSSADCENAALALLSIATSAGAGWSGTYQAVNLQLTSDVWPGDGLAIQSAASAANVSVVARAVTITCQACVPEVLDYSIEFADDWAVDLSVKTSSSVPKSTWLPQTALAAPSSLASLSGLTVNVTTTQLTVTAGTTAPAGGGFEVRRVDWQFGAGSDGTLVLRSAVPNFSILRESAIEQYYVRMYDASIPRNYSRFSSAICVSVPL